MKRTFLFLPLLFSLCTLVTAQRKMQFGVTVQGGNYLQARQGQETDIYHSSKHQLKGKVLNGVGVYAEHTLAPRTALYGGINYFQSAFSEHLTTIYPYGSGIFEEYVKQQAYYYTIHQIALPLQLQLRTGVHRRLAFSIGTAPCIMITKRRSDAKDESLAKDYYAKLAYIDIITPSYRYYHLQSLAPSTKFQLLFMAGLHYRPDEHNALGLEFWLGSKENQLEKSSLDAYSDVHSYAFSNHPYQMRSLQLSLRHSW